MQICKGSNNFLSSVFIFTFEIIRRRRSIKFERPKLFKLTKLILKLKNILENKICIRKKYFFKCLFAYCFYKPDIAFCHIENRY